MTGITLEEFQPLLEEVQPRFDAVEQQRLKREQRKRAPGGGAKPRWDLRGRLLMTLVWLRLYLTCEAVGVLFDVDKGTVSRYTHPVLLILRDLGADTLGWPEEAQVLLAGEEPNDAPSEPPPPPSCPDMVAIVDATEQRVERPQDHATQKAHYSGKKKAHTRKTQIVVNEKGRVRSVSDSVPGSVHDLALMRQSQVSEQMPPELSAMGDSGYQGMQDDMPERSVALPYRATRGHPLTPEQKLHNHELSRIRIVVENTLARMKVFRVLRDAFRHAIELYDSIILAIVGIVNRRMDKQLARLSTP
jgi:transposase